MNFNLYLQHETDVLKILGKIIPNCYLLLFVAILHYYMAISKVCSFIRKFFPR